MNLRDVIERAVWTGVQTFIAVIGLDDVSTSIDIPLGKELAAAGIAAALSTIKTIMVQRLQVLSVRRDVDPST